jgi:hypothetical protein
LRGKTAAEIITADKKLEEKQDGRRALPDPEGPLVSQEVARVTETREKRNKDLMVKMDACPAREFEERLAKIVLADRKAEIEYGINQYRRRVDNFPLTWTREGLPHPPTSLAEAGLKSWETGLRTKTEETWEWQVSDDKAWLVLGKDMDARRAALKAKQDATPHLRPLKPSNGPASDCWKLLLADAAIIEWALSVRYKWERWKAIKEACGTVDEIFRTMPIRPELRVYGIPIETLGMVKRHLPDGKKYDVPDERDELRDPVYFDMGLSNQHNEVLTVDDAGEPVSWAKPDNQDVWGSDDDGDE